MSSPEHHALASFQAQFMAGLLAPWSATPVTQSSAWLSHPGMAVYRNTVITGLVDTLRAAYPIVARLTGDEWFNSAARHYALTHLPEQPALCWYGAEFAAFLAQLDSLREFPYVAEVARIERAWLTSAYADDAPILQATDLKQRASADWVEQCWALHPATKLVWVTHSAFTIFSEQREQSDADHAHGSSLHLDPLQEISFQEQGVLITRIDGVVVATAIDHATYCFVDAVARGASLSDAALQTLTQHADADVASIMARVLKQHALRM